MAEEVKEEVKEEEAAGAVERVISRRSNKRLKRHSLRYIRSCRNSLRYKSWCRPARGSRSGHTIGNIIGRTQQAIDTAVSNGVKAGIIGPK